MLADYQPALQSIKHFQHYFILFSVNLLLYFSFFSCSRSKALSASSGGQIPKLSFYDFAPGGGPVQITARAVMRCPATSVIVLPTCKLHTLHTATTKSLFFAPIGNSISPKAEVGGGKGGATVGAVGADCSHWQEAVGAKLCFCPHKI